MNMDKLMKYLLYAALFIMALGGIYFMFRRLSVNV